MAKNPKKIIETFQVIVETDQDTTLTFEELLLSKSAKDYEAYVAGKTVQMTILDDGKRSGTIIGMVETTRQDNIPPKRHIKQKKIQALGLQPGEGLAYGNIFIYEKKRKLLMYEVNKFGCYVNHFLDFFQSVCEEDDKCDWRFNLKINTILKPDQYVRMKQMEYYKSLEVKFANPIELAKAYTHSNDALKKSIEMSKELHSETTTCKFDVRSKRQGGAGLANRTLRDMISGLKKLLNTEAGSYNIKTVKVYGYAQDDDGGEKLEPIDLLADRYLAHITLKEPRENVDLLESQRKSEIIRVYKESLDDFKIMFGK